MPPVYMGDDFLCFIPRGSDPDEVDYLMRRARFGYGPEGEYEEMVSRGERPETRDRRHWNKAIPGPRRVEILRRYVRKNPADPEDPCPRWIKCNCTDHGGGIQMRWGHAPYCEWCGALL